jgi:hypothetical protein
MMYVPDEELEKVEGVWRSVFNRLTKRAQSTPRLQIYDETGGGNLRNARRHLVAIGAAALHSAFCRALADKAPTPQRCTARSACTCAIVNVKLPQDRRQREVGIGGRWRSCSM